MPHVITQQSKHSFATCVDVIIDVGIARASLEYRSVIIMTFRFLHSVRNSGPRAFMKKKLEVPEGGNT